MMEGFLDTLEDWLLDCGEAYPSGNDTAGTVVHLQAPSVLPSLAETGGLTEQQAQQLLAVCDTQCEKLLTAIFALLEERNKYCELLDQVLRQLFLLSRCHLSKLRLFALQFSPSLIYIDLLSLSTGDAKMVSSVELVLLALYNCEVLNELGQFRLPHSRLPTLARHSIYHDPASLGPASFSADSLVRYERSEERLPPLPPATLPLPGVAPPPAHSVAIREGSMSSNSNSSGGGANSSINRKNSTVNNSSSQHLSSMTAATRPVVLSSVMAAFNATVSCLHRTALLQLCRYTSRLVTHGLPRSGAHQQRSSWSEGASNTGAVPALPTPRLAASPDLLLQLVLAAYAAVHKLGESEVPDEDSSPSNGTVPNPTAKKKSNSLPSLHHHHHHHHRHHKRSRSSGGSECVCVAIQAIEDIQLRCECDLLPDMLHLCYAVTHSLKHDNIINGEGSDASPLVYVPPPPSTPLAKTCITNASFRTKKLPEDIPVQPLEGAAVGDPKVLVSISEDTDGEGREDGPVPGEGGSSLGAGAKLAGILRREGRDSGRKESNRDSEGSKEKSSSKFTPTKFTSSNIVIPGLKRKDKTKNGDKKDKENVDEGRKSDSKRDRMKERSNGFTNGSRSGSGVQSSVDGGDATDCSGSEDASPTKGAGKSSSKYHKEQEQLQQLIEMRIINRPSSASLHDQPQGSPQLSHSGPPPSAVQQLRQQDSASLSDSYSSSPGVAEHNNSDGASEYRKLDSVDSGEALGSV
ncbi:hyccin [Hyalella azteca]|uniref:Hyccin n=1 Tax=Hyalella azteca TaxID=294128 RepID=A0A8B7PHQ7_HYAAZ|nr:hyccin [Hyalella azteca]